MRMTTFNLFAGTALALGLSLAQAAGKPAASAPAPAAKPVDPVLAQAAKETGAKVLPNGVVVRTLKAGTGAAPTDTSTVTVHYKGTFPDGRVFDASPAGQPISFPLNHVISCWTLGVQQIKVGGKAKLTCPANTAYGERGAPPDIPPNAVLVFEVELLKIGQ